MRGYGEKSDRNHVVLPDKQKLALIELVKRYPVPVDTRELADAVGARRSEPLVEKLRATGVIRIDTLPPDERGLKTYRLHSILGIEAGTFSVVDESGGLRVIVGGRT